MSKLCLVRLLIEKEPGRHLKEMASHGDEGTRTPGLLRAREALSHLSYIPALVVNGNL